MKKKVLLQDIMVSIMVVFGVIAGLGFMLYLVGCLQVNSNENSYYSDVDRSNNVMVTAFTGNDNFEQPEGIENVNWVNLSMLNIPEYLPAYQQVNATTENRPPVITLGNQIGFKNNIAYYPAHKFEMWNGNEFVLDEKKILSFKAEFLDPNNINYGNLDSAWTSCLRVSLDTQGTPEIFKNFYDTRMLTAMMIIHEFINSPSQEYPVWNDNTSDQDFFMITRGQFDLLFQKLAVQCYNKFKERYNLFESLSGMTAQEFADFLIDSYPEKICYAATVNNTIMYYNPITRQYVHGSE